MNTTETCTCPHCAGIMEYPAANAGTSAGCPHCSNEVVLPELKAVHAPAPAPKPGLLRMRLNSGVDLSVTAIRMYSEDDVIALHKKKAEVSKLMGGISTGLIPIGSLGYAVGASVAIGVLEGLFSAGAASKGEELLVEVIKLERKVRAQGSFCKVGGVENIESPMPQAWRYPYSKIIQSPVINPGGNPTTFETAIVLSARIHIGDEFIVAATEDGKTCSFRWSAVDHYVFSWI